MRIPNPIHIALLVCGLLTGFLRAETYITTAGQEVKGDAVSFNDKGAVIKLEDGSYADRIEWGKFTQETLKKFATNPKSARYVEAFIEPSEEEKVEAAKRTEIVIKTDYPKLEQPPKKGLFSALFSSGIGILGLLLIYGANIYAGYEVSVFRIRPAALVCGVSAILPILGPIIFLCMPTVVESKEDIIQEPAREKESYHVGDMVAEAELPADAVVDAGPKLPPTQSFPRGQFTFNRRFIETKFAGFFGVVRRDAEKDLVLIVKSAGGVHTADRITRIGAAEFHIECHDGGVAQEVMIPFLEIQEIVLKHKDAH